MSKPSNPRPHRRRLRYAGKNPRRFEDKYKELNPERYQDEVAKVLSAGKTPAGSHRPIMVAEIVSVLALQAGEVVVDCTVGFGGHARELLSLLGPRGRLIGLDVDPLELPKTTARLLAAGWGEEVYSPVRTNFAALPKVLAELGIASADGGTSQRLNPGFAMIRLRSSIPEWLGSSAFAAPVALILSPPKMPASVLAAPFPIAAMSTLGQKQKSGAAVQESALSPKADI